MDEYKMLGIVGQLCVTCWTLGTMEAIWFVRSLWCDLASWRKVSNGLRPTALAATSSLLSGDDAVGTRRRSSLIDRWSFCHVWNWRFQAASCSSQWPLCLDSDCSWFTKQSLPIKKRSNIVNITERRKNKPAIFDFVVSRSREFSHFC